MEIGIYLDNENAKMSTRAYRGDVGYDLYSIEDVIIPKFSFKEIKTGVHLAMPRGIFAQINTRSSFARKGLFVHHGVIDSGFTGELTVHVYNLGYQVEIKKGDRIAQILFHKAERPKLKIINKLPITERGDKGHGSSGK